MELLTEFVRHGLVAIYMELLTEFVRHALVAINMELLTEFLGAQLSTPSSRMAPLLLKLQQA
jgi:hypothetical protein